VAGDLPTTRTVTVDETAEPATRGARSLIGRVLGDFLVTAPLPAGAHQGVWRATQRSLGREAIIKTLDAGQAAPESLVQRFLLEARLAARLDHPYAAHVYAFGAEADGLLWIAMELVRGTPLDALLQADGPLPAERFVPFVQRLAEVVDAAHEAGIVHRDIKPANVMVLTRAGALFPKLLDFGVATLLEETPAGTGPATTTLRRLVGSPHYMAPEQWSASARPLPESDLYSLGVLSFEALSGRLPFDAVSLDGLARAHAGAPVPLLDPAAPRPIDAVMQRALAKTPAERYSSAQRLAAALQAALAPSVAASLPRLPERVRDAFVMHAPRPLAEAVADLDSAHHPHQALDALWHLVSVAARLVGVYALAARAATTGGPRDEAAVGELLRALRQRPLGDAEWLQLARALLARPEKAHPLPELLALLPRFDSLLALRGAAAHPSESRARELLERGVTAAAELLDALAVLGDYVLVVGAPEGVEAWMGVRRSRRNPAVALAGSLPPGHVGLAGRDGALLLTLTPLVQVKRPLPTLDEELFLLDGSDGANARLSAGRDGFVLSDPTLWSWLGSRLQLDVAAAAQEEAAAQAPYLGLAAFSAEQAGLFVGREREVESFVNRLRVQSFVAIVGPSGAGKSSFVGAGVIPELPRSWRAVVVRPGPAPLEALAARLAREGLWQGDLRAALAADPDALGARLRREGEAGPIVLVVDQFEELFTLCPDADERQRYAEALARAARSTGDPVRVVIALRDDFLVRVEQLPALRDRVSQGFQLLATPATDDLLRILTEPARRAGYEFDDPALPREMVRSVATQSGALALLSFTGLRLWEQRDRHFRRLTRRAYDEMGGVGGALAQHAEATLHAMPPSERALVREALRRLVTSEGTRAVLPRAEMLQVLGGGAAAEDVIERLIGARLVVASDTDFGQDQLEIIHEALVVQWPRLVEWRREDAEGTRLRDQLRAAAQQWHQRRRPRGLLWRDDALAEYRAWRARSPTPLSDVEAAFADASLHDARRSRRVRRLLIATAGIVLAAGLLVLRLSERRAAQNARRAELQVALQFEEKGREAFFSGDPMRAIVYLSEALNRGRDGATLRYPLASATAALSRETLSLDHGAPLWAVAVAPDGGTLVTGGEDGRVKVWDANTGRLRLTLNAHHAEVRNVEISSDGALLVTSSPDGTAKLWNLATGALVRSFEGHGAAVRAARFAPDGRHLLTAARDATVRIWDLDRDVSPITFVAHDLPLWTARWSPDGQHVVTASSDATARVWDARSGKRQFTLVGHRDWIVDAIYSADGRSIATASSDRTARSWDAASGRQRAVMVDPLQQIEKIAFSPDGSRLVTGGMDKLVKVWNTSDGRLLEVLAGHASYVNAVAVNDEGTLIATASSDGTARLWNAATGQQAGTLLGHFDGIWTLHFFPDGRRLVTAAHDGVAKVWDTRQADGLVFRGNTDAVRWAGFSRDGRRLFTTGQDHTARVWNAATGDLLATLPLTWRDRYYEAASWDPSGKRVLVCDGDNAKLVRIFDGSETWLRAHRGPVKHAAFNADGRFVVTASADGTAKLWETETGRLLGSYPSRAAWVYAAAVSADGRRVATVVSDHDIEVRDAASGERLALFAGGGLGFHELDFSPDGRRLLSAGQDKTAKIWEIGRERPLLSVEGHHADVLSAHFSPDGTRIVTGGADGVANVWDAATGELLLSFHAAQSINWAAFAPDGKRIVGAGDDRSARVWPIVLDPRPPAEVARFARCKIPFRLHDGRIERSAIDRETCAAH
jgi:WD40 repeat protein/tRNA A-37 threonylcarbamoyl transferase component Bud32